LWRGVERRLCTQGVRHGGCLACRHPMGPPAHMVSVCPRRRVACPSPAGVRALPATVTMHSVHRWGLCLQSAWGVHEIRLSALRPGPTCRRSLYSAGLLAAGTGILMTCPIVFWQPAGMPVVRLSAVSQLANVWLVSLPASTPCGPPVCWQPAGPRVAGPPACQHPLWSACLLPASWPTCGWSACLPAPPVVCPSHCDTAGGMQSAQGRVQLRACRNLERLCGMLASPCTPCQGACSTWINVGDIGEGRHAWVGWNGW
jgi:hypothetical protein